MGGLTIQCCVDPFTQHNVVTLRGATHEEADQIFWTAHERSSESIFHGQGHRTLWLKDWDVFIHHYTWSGGDVELVSHCLSCEQLRDLLPEALSSRILA